MYVIDIWQFFWGAAFRVRIWVHLGVPFGVVLGAKFVTILLFGRPVDQTGSQKAGKKEGPKNMKKGVSIHRVTGTGTRPLVRW